MRKVAAEEELFGKEYPPLIFLEPASSIGFLIQGNESGMVFSNAKEALVVVSQYTTTSAGELESLIGKVGQVTNACRGDKDVLSYYPMKRIDGVETELTVLERYTSQKGYESVMEKLGALM